LNGKKNGQCYGRSQKCAYAEGCVNYHPQCDFIDGLLGINFPLDEYNTIYDPALIPTQEFSHRLIYKESSKDYDSKIHCIWRDDVGNWIMGLCKNIDYDIGHYYLDTGSECPDVDNGWKDGKNNQSINGMMKEIKDRITVGRRIIKTPIAGIFLANGPRNRGKIRMCLEWTKIPYRNQWKCLKFFPPIRNPTVKEKIPEVKRESNCKVTSSNDCNSKDESKIKNEETGIKKELGDDDPIIGNIQKNNIVEKEKDNSINTDDTDDTEYEYGSITNDTENEYGLITDDTENEYDSILDDIFY